MKSFIAAGRVDASHLAMISNPGTVTNVILQAVRVTS